MWSFSEWALKEDRCLETLTVIRGTLYSSIWERKGRQSVWKDSCNLLIKSWWRCVRQREWKFAENLGLQECWIRLVIFSKSIQQNLVSSGLTKLNQVWEYGENKHANFLVQHTFLYNLSGAQSSFILINVTLNNTISNCSCISSFTSNSHIQSIHKHFNLL